MGFSNKEEQVLLELEGVGPTVKQRLEEIGINSFKVLRTCKAEDITDMQTWRNSPTPHFNQ